MTSEKSTLRLSEAPSLRYGTAYATIVELSCSLSAKGIEHSTNRKQLTSRAITDHSAAQPDEVPQVIFFPKSTEDVQAIVRACHDRNIAITSYGGGTSMCGALAATRGGACIDFKYMDKILELHEDDMDVVVQPNVGYVELNQMLEEKKLFFPPDPAPGAKIGGMVAMSASGTNTYRYGTMKEWVISLTLVLADGTVVKTRNRPRKSSAGYDLTHLVIGSEGTLALVTEAVLKLTALPQNLHVGLVTFPSLDAGVSVALTILRSGHLLEAVELLDGPSMQAIADSGLVSEPVSGSPTLFVKFAGSQQNVTAQIDFVAQLCRKHGGRSMEFSADRDRIRAIWGVRKCLANALVTKKKDPTDLFLHTDAAVPISRMAELIRKSDDIVKSSSHGKDWFCASVGHVGDGNVHTAIICPAALKPHADVLITRIQELALSLDGTITGEHGVGAELRELLPHEVGQSGVDLMRKIKFALDPKGILNPDKVVATQREAVPEAKL